MKVDPRTFLDAYENSFEYVAKTLQLTDDVNDAFRKKMKDGFKDLLDVNLIFYDNNMHIEHMEFKTEEDFTAFLLKWT